MDNVINETDKSGHELIQDTENLSGEEVLRKKTSELLHQCIDLSHQISERLIEPENFLISYAVSLLEEPTAEEQSATKGLLETGKKEGAKEDFEKSDSDTSTVVKHVESLALDTAELKQIWTAVPTHTRSVWNEIAGRDTPTGFLAYNAQGLYPQRIKYPISSESGTIRGTFKQFVIGGKYKSGEASLRPNVQYVVDDLIRGSISLNKDYEDLSEYPFEIFPNLAVLAHETMHGYTWENLSKMEAWEKVRKFQSPQSFEYFRELFSDLAEGDMGTIVLSKLFTRQYTTGRIKGNKESYKQASQLDEMRLRDIEWKAWFLNSLGVTSTQIVSMLYEELASYSGKNIPEHMIYETAFNDIVKRTMNEMWGTKVQDIRPLRDEAVKFSFNTQFLRTLQLKDAVTRTIFPYYRSVTSDRDFTFLDARPVQTDGKKRQFDTIALARDEKHETEKNIFYQVGIVWDDDFSEAQVDISKLAIVKTLWDAVSYKWSNQFADAEIDYILTSLMTSKTYPHFRENDIDITFTSLERERSSEDTEIEREFYEYMNKRWQTIKHEVNTGSSDN